MVGGAPPDPRTIRWPLEALDFIPTRANAFVAELDHAIRQIQDNSEGWPMHMHGTRKFLFRRFPYQVIYRIIESTIQVIAVAHGRRRPGYWKSRRF